MIRAILAKIIGKLFTTETLLLAFKQHPEVVRVEIVTGRELEQMQQYFEEPVEQKTYVVGADCLPIGSHEIH